MLTLDLGQVTSGNTMFKRKNLFISLDNSAIQTQ